MNPVPFSLRYPDTFREQRRIVSELAALMKVCRENGHPHHMAGTSDLCLNAARVRMDSSASAPGSEPSALSRRADGADTTCAPTQRPRPTPHP